MRMSSGVEWCLHACLSLAWADQPVPVARLAALNDLPPSSLNKHLQSLVRAGLVRSTSGPSGGFALARPPAQITFLDVVEAVEGPTSAFRCTEIRQQGPIPASPEACRMPCTIAAAMAHADSAWRSSLAQTTLADIGAELHRTVPGVPESVADWLRETSTS